MTDSKHLEVTFTLTVPSWADRETVLLAIVDMCNLGAAQLPFPARIKGINVKPAGDGSAKRNL